MAFAVIVRVIYANMDIKGRTVCIDYGTKRREKSRDIYKESSGISSGMPVPSYATRHSPPGNAILLSFITDSSKNFRIQYAQKKPRTKEPSGRPVKAVVPEIP